MTGNLEISPSHIDLDEVDGSGTLIKEEVADLMNIYDPRDVAENGRTNTVFTFPFTTIHDKNECELARD